MTQQKPKTTRMTCIGIALAGLAMLVILAAIAGGVTVYFATKDYNDIREAIDAGDTFAVRCFLLRGAGVNAGDEDGRTPLNHAVACDTPDIANLLIANGADVDASDDSGMTPLHFAVRFQKPWAARMLVAEGADVNARTNQGLTPLHGAAYLGRRDILNLLIAAGADVNAKTKDGETPLAFAVEKWGDREMAALLRKHGARE